MLLLHQKSADYTATYHYSLISDICQLIFEISQKNLDRTGIICYNVENNLIGKMLMQYPFLYKKAYRVGILYDDHSDYFYWMQDKFSDLEFILQNAPPEELNLVLQTLFAQSFLNYRILLYLFACRYKDSNHIIATDVHRKNQDITNIELWLTQQDDKSLIIHKMIVRFESGTNYTYYN